MVFVVSLSQYNRYPFILQDNDIVKIQSFGGGDRNDLTRPVPWVMVYEVWGLPKTHDPTAS